ncbi:MAG: hypothetical protein HY654_09625, partial [Acidobacteria bacterium]|nr:hypothetical protein [Acidobacteriota bacterium]
MPSRRSSILLLISLTLAAPAGCGKKGPPLAPIVRVPDRVAGLTARRQGNEVLIRLTIPSTNANGLGPADIERVDIYAFT